MIFPLGTLIGLTGKSFWTFLDFLQDMDELCLCSVWFWDHVRVRKVYPRSGCLCYSCGEVDHERMRFHASVRVFLISVWLIVDIHSCRTNVYSTSA